MPSLRGQEPRIRSEPRISWPHEVKRKWEIKFSFKSKLLKEKDKYWEPSLFKHFEEKRDMKLCEGISHPFAVISELWREYQVFLAKYPSLHPDCSMKRPERLIPVKLKSALLCFSLLCPENELYSTDSTCVVGHQWIRLQWVFPITKKIIITDQLKWK